MKRLLALLVLTAICFTASFGQSNKTRPTAQDLDQYISQLYKAYYPDAVAPGFAVAVVKDSRVVLVKGFGYADVEAKRPVTPQTVFYIASSAKPFFSLTAALLDHKNQIDLDAPLSSYLPDAKLQSPLSAENIKLRNLLTHSHGIAEGPVDFRMGLTGQGTRSELIALLGEHRGAKGGNEFEYSNRGYLIASLALDTKLNKSWKDVVQSTVLDPVGMKNTNTYFSRVNKDQLATPYHTGSGDYLRLSYGKADANMHAAGGIVTTAEDLAKWLLVNIDNGKLDGRQIFPSAVVAETHRLQVEQDTPFSWVRRYGYGLGWNIGSYEGETLIHHHGGFSAFYSHVSFMPEHRLGVAVLTNELVLGDALAENIAQYVYDTFLDLPGIKFRWTKRLATTPQYAQRGRESIASERARRATRQKPLPLPLEAYAGVYESAQGGRMEWRVQNGKLAVSIGPLFSEAEVYDAAKNEVRIEIQPGRGNVVAFEVSGNQVVGVNVGPMKFKRVG
ncbi:MAG TPA: serine hydrolase [Pyrinomonadaceae bacterium]|nr:serine hydrolase [Pyrinomonadaceae bacterium]